MENVWGAQVEEVVPDHKRCCGNWHWVNRETKVTHIWYCNSGRCDLKEECRKVWAIRRIALICELLETYKLDRFFTLTIPRNLSMELSWELMPYLWSKLRKRLNRYYKKAGVALKFVAILESHKDGYPHIHGFLNQYIPRKVLLEMWEAVGGGMIVDIRKVDSTVKVGEYVGKQLNIAKYVGKQDLQNALKHLPKGHRTIWRSIGMLTTKERDKRIPRISDWYIDRGDRNETQWKRPILEATFSKIPERSSKEGIKGLASHKWEGEYQETFEFT